MILKEYIKNQEEAIAETEKLLEKGKKKLAYLKCLKEVSMSELYAFLANPRESKNILFTIHSRANAEYEEVLGGDGRSSPWSKIKTGRVYSVTFNGNYFDEKQLTIIKQYIIDEHKDKFDHLHLPNPCLVPN